MEQCKQLVKILEKSLNYLQNLSEKYFSQPLPYYQELTNYFENFNREDLDKIEEIFNKLLTEIELIILSNSAKTSAHIKKILENIKENLNAIKEDIASIDNETKKLSAKIDKFNNLPEESNIKIEMKKFLNNFSEFFNKMNDKINQISATVNSEIRISVAKDLELEKLREKVFVDELTGLLNLRGFETVFSRLKIEKVKACMLFIDIDNFKNVNDTYGHLAGDLILKKLSEIMKENLRESDVTARIYGDEFIIIFKNINKERSFAIAERMREKISKGKFLYNNKPIKITISGGLILIDYSLTKDENINKADKLLYEAKKIQNKIIVE